MTLYLSTQQYETLDLDTATDDDLDAWELDRIDPPTQGLIAVRPTGNPTRVQCIITSSQLETQFSQV